MPGGKSPGPSIKKPCKVWVKACSKKGYGQRWVNGKLRYTHRLEWERHHGPIPKGLEVCHHCDNPPCYEITHLFLGTRLDNMRDAARKGRAGPRQRCDRDVMVQRYLDGESSEALAEEFGVHKNTVTKYARRVAPSQTKVRWGGARW